MSREEPSSQASTAQADTLQRKTSKKRARDESAKQSPVKKHKSGKAKDTTATTNGESTPRSRTAPTTTTTAATSSSSKQKRAKPSADSKTTDNDRHSPFHTERISLYLALSPIAYESPLEGAIAEHISPLLLTYFAPLDGIVLSFDNARLSTLPESDSTEHGGGGGGEGRLLGQSLDEYGVTYVWLTADFLVFRPREGTVVEGVVNLQSQSTLGLLCYNYFNASIARTQLPPEWEWIEDEEGDGSQESHFVDGSGKKVEGLLSFKVKGFDTSNHDGVGTVNVHGTLLEEARGASEQ